MPNPSHTVRDVLPPGLQHPAVEAVLRLALAEDLAPTADWPAIADDPAAGDITSAATLPTDLQLTGTIYAKADGVMAGGPLVDAIAALVSPALRVTLPIADGTQVTAGEPIATLTGPGRALLAAERPALNLLGRCSGIATQTRTLVDAIAGTGATLLDTRKTAPGLRRIDKYAVQQGGGQNHRMGLFDEVLIKENHIAAAGSIEAAIDQVRDAYGDQYPVVVEVQTLDELAAALQRRPTRILLDNMTLDEMRTAVAQAHGTTPLEASGNVTHATIRGIAETGVDFISVGALTHSASTLDVSLRLTAG
ncbi:MAG: carboxylating nicotinate-nucleotide diphosphorylase [Bacteroidetes bacterium]|jgi:nicotinate-nucleotide pyrophosphorylase (carboxylating)|nr:carboxylating nicotinate-nucleotide diphosphorylase [Bacteroidota bacterium]